MRKIVHISDVHFGRIDPATVEPLVAAVNRVQPDVVVISGDLTQRARPEQFADARDFLKSLPGPQLVVPGNHDVPLYDVWSRFAAPLVRYRSYICDELNPHFADDEICIQGLNTARSLTWKNGRISEAQIELLRKSFSTAAPQAIKILVTHHPLDLPRRFGDDELVGGAQAAMTAAAESGVDVLMAGHYHIAHTGDTSARYPIQGFAALVVQSGTSTSSRLRDEPNSFNLLEVAADRVTVDRFLWRPADGVFASELTEHFRKQQGVWVRQSSVVPEGKGVAVPDVPSTPTA